MQNEFVVRDLNGSVVLEVRPAPAREFDIRIMDYERGTFLTASVNLAQLVSLAEWARNYRKDKP